ncbi:uncharacterized protein EDB93DRAFT_1094070 [Suillus bovinus]|uniref:uncharacterized protein n=1 Tax=Suillus bovinus TaxID=48563 RepID=UPI001B86F7C4|nr:uncharacterized protein EDB93DRAFT_1094070 [Suillus bovinus]KAG2132150.1 hypothetical protein EDB93DRAFT_1094070 [Suillus bovinus]
MHEFLKTEEFRDHIRAYIKQNIRAHVDGLDEETVRTTPHESKLGYSCPPNPDGADWEAECADKERRVVRSQQVHTCTKSTCLHYNKHGRLVCKRRAPWELSDTEYIDENRNWKPKRTHPYINNYCPAISVSLCCNNDIKLLTNGVDMKHASWYLTDYQTKKQNKNNNVSALMAQSLMYHEQHSDHLESVLDRNRLLLFRCQHALNHEMELSGQQVMAYLMGWGDHICSHRYVSLYWSGLRRSLLATFPGLQSKKFW